MFDQVNELSEALFVNWDALGKYLLYMFAAALFAYFLLARTLNPFSLSRRKSTRNRVRFARHVAFSLIQSSVVLYLYGGFTPRHFVLFSLLMASLIFVPASLIYMMTRYKIRKSSMQSEIGGFSDGR